MLIDLDDTCVPDRAATEAAIADLLAELGLRADGAAVGNLLAAARARWQTGPFYQHCLYMGISSWEGLWVEEPRSPEGFADGERTTSGASGGTRARPSPTPSRAGTRRCVQSAASPTRT